MRNVLSDPRVQQGALTRQVPDERNRKESR
jgi:hypothetical protein